MKNGHLKNTVSAYMNKHRRFTIYCSLIIGFLCFSLLSFWVGLRIASNAKQIEAVIQDYPECRFGICPSYFSMDVDGDHLSESVVVQPTAMTQGAGKVMIIKNGKKIFETEEMAQIWVKAVDDGNGFILQYSSPRDENMNVAKYEKRYTFSNGQFISK